MTDDLAELNRALFEDSTLRTKTVVRRVGDTWAVFRPLFEIAGNPQRLVYRYSTHAWALAVAVVPQLIDFRVPADD